MGDGRWGNEGGVSPHFPQWVLETSRCCLSIIDCPLYLMRRSRGGGWEVRWAQMGSKFAQTAHMLCHIKVHVSERLI